MKKYLTPIIILLSLAFAINTFAKAQEESLDGIVATVNDEIITQSELKQAMLNARMQMTQSQATIPTDKAFKALVLNQLINKRLQLQLAKQAGINVPNVELDKVLTNIANNNNITLKDLYNKIKAEGLSVESYRNDIHDELTIQKLQQQEIASRITVTPLEVEEFMRTQHNKPATAPTPDANTISAYRLDDILIPLPEPATAADTTKAQKLANAILAELQKGKKLKEVTATMKSAVTSNDLGWRKPDEIPSVFAKQVASMKLHDVAGPIQAGNGFHIIQLAEVRGSAIAPMPLSKEQAEQMVFQKKMGDALDNWVSKLRSQAFIVTPD